MLVVFCPQKISRKINFIRQIIFGNNLRKNSLVVPAEEKAEEDNLKNKLTLIRKIVQEKENELRKTTAEVKLRILAEKLSEINNKKDQFMTGNTYIMKPTGLNGILILVKFPISLTLPIILEN